MTPRLLTDEEYADLKQKLHQAHDKIIKKALQEKEGIREFSGKIVMPLLQGLKINLDNLQLDTTTYIGSNLQAFYADVVYLTDLIDETAQTQEPVKVALLIEHKSQMPSQLVLRLQVSEYINAIMKMNYDAKTDSTIPVLTVIFNQFQKGWTVEPFRGLFPHASDKIAQFIPEFNLVIINLADLPDALMESLDKFGVLKATLLAMKNVRNKQFLIHHFEDIFLFLQKHPHEITLRDQLIAYLLGQSQLEPHEIEELLNNIFSPILKKDVMFIEEGFIAVAARNERVKAEAEAERAMRLQIRLTAIRGWYKGISLNILIDVVDLPANEVKRLVNSCQKVKAYYAETSDTDIVALKKLSGLGEAELTALLKLLAQPQA